jgi:hypothetical protein
MYNNKLACFFEVLNQPRIADKIFAMLVLLLKRDDQT